MQKGRNGLIMITATATTRYLMGEGDVSLLTGKRWEETVIAAKCLSAHSVSENKLTYT